MRFVPVKSLEQQGTLALHAARSLLVKQQTMLANAMRGLATEFGLTVPQGIGKLGQLMVSIGLETVLSSCWWMNEDGRHSGPRIRARTQLR